MKTEVRWRQKHRIKITKTTNPGGKCNSYKVKKEIKELETNEFRRVKDSFAFIRGLIQDVCEICWDVTQQEERCVTSLKTAAKETKAQGNIEFARQTLSKSMY